MKFTPDYSKSAAMGFFLGSQERVRNSHDKRAISVRAIEVLLYTMVKSPSLPCTEFYINETRPVAFALRKKLK